jgi:homoserine kinase type II
MAVFTEVPFEEAAELLARLDLGQLTAFHGIAAGIENTNYFADTAQGRYVLTVFERLTFEQLPFYLHLMKHLARKGVAVPEPQADRQGEILHRLQGKPAAVVNRLEGSHHLAPTAGHCAQVGAALAGMHLAASDYPLRQPNLRGLDWWTETVPVVLPFLTPEQKELIEAELHFQQHLGASAAYRQLPTGPIHADLFRDNVMFDGDRLSGFFDFYFAGVDTHLFDIAVCLNDWCVDLETGRLVEERAQAFVAAYDEAYPLSPNEARLLPALMRAGALRFWISRLWDYHLPRQASVLQAHDPRHFERILRCRVETPWHFVRGGAPGDDAAGIPGTTPP